MAKSSVSLSCRPVVLVAILVSGLSVSGCVTMVEPDGTAETPGSLISQTAAASEDKQTVVVVAPVVTEPEPEPEPRLLPVPDPASLVGYDDLALVDLLGSPTFTRQDPPAELWQYRNSVCTLDLFLYETTGGGHSVEYLEFRETGATTEAAENCLRAIIEKKADATPSA